MRREDEIEDQEMAKLMVPFYCKFKQDSQTFQNRLNVKRAMLRPDEILEENDDFTRNLQKQYDSNRKEYRLRQAIYDDFDNNDTKMTQDN